MSIDVCDGSVIEGKIVLACHVTAPSAAIFFNVGASLSAMTAGFAPSRLMMNTCSARGAASADRLNAKAEKRVLVMKRMAGGAK